MITVSEFIKDNNLKVSVNVVNGTYFCYIKDGKETFTFSMTRERLLEHMKRFCARQFVDVMMKDEKWIMTHFRKLAVTWWHIQVCSKELSRELEIK